MKSNNKDILLNNGNLSLTREDFSLEFINCMNVAENGSYIIQECINIQNRELPVFYIIWDKNKREHLKENNAPIIFSTREQALNFTNPEMEVER